MIDPISVWLVSANATVQQLESCDDRVSRQKLLTHKPTNMYFAIPEGVCLYLALFQPITSIASTKTHAKTVDPIFICSAKYFPKNRAYG
jgi:hypothetical protein